MSYIKLCYVYVKFNEPIKVAHLQKLANQSMLNGALRNGNSFSESQKNFDLLMNRKTPQEKINRCHYMGSAWVSP